jgi:hypothetical protein
MAETGQAQTGTDAAGDGRAEHLRWCKDRALAYADMGDVSSAVASLGSDLRKHPGTRNHGGVELMMMHAMAGLFDRPGELRKFIEGFQ